MPQYDKLNTSLRDHLLIGLLGGLWITLFLVVVGPFDTAPLPMAWRARVMFGYGIVFFLSYLPVIPLQRKLYRWRNRWGWAAEGLMLAIVFLICWPATYAYYRSEIIRGDFFFAAFSLQIYLPSLVVFVPLVFIARRYANRQTNRRRSAEFRPIDTELDLPDWKSRVDQLMTEGYYLNPNITLKDMADQLGTNSSVLSKVINQGYGTNFNDFINHYRLEAVLAALREGKHETRTLPGIAQDCGFNSKATFNRAFKKQLGVTPSDYIRRIS